MKSCPRCGASNPDNNKFCGNCGAPLAAPTPPSDSVPAWLHEQTPAPSGAAPAAETQELPAWLNDLGIEDEAPATREADQAPDWLAQLQQKSPTTAPVEPTSNDLPDWLREIEAETPPAAVAPAPVSDELPDWLREDDLPTTSQAGGPGTVAGTPAAWGDQRDAATGTAPPVESARPTPPAESSTEELPAWLRDFDEPAGAQPVNTGAADVAARDELPPWLREDEPQTASNAATASTAEELPPWLREVETPAASGATEVPPADELPAWLRTDEPTAEAAPAANGSTISELPPWLNSDQEAVVPATTPAVPDELPPWLRTDDVPAVAEASAASEPATPAWLHENTPEQIAAPPAADAELPAWLRADDSEAPSTNLDVPVPDWSSEFGAPTEAAATEALPAWLAETGSDAPVKAQPANDAPSWLIEESPTAPATSETQPLPAHEATTDTELPAWLRDSTTSATPEASPPANDAVPAWLRDEAAPAQNHQPIDQSERDSTDELPAWLRDETLSSGPTTPGADDDLPSWLQSTDEPAPLSSTGVPDWLALPDQPDAPQHVESSPAAAPLTPNQSDWDSEGDVSGAPALPAWLQADDQAVPTARIYDTPATNADDQPDVARIYNAPAAVTGTPDQPHAPAGAETVQLPAWLSEPGTQASQPAKPDDAELPAWLSGIAPEETSAPAQAASTLPDWLDEPQAGGPPAKADAPQSEFVTGLDLPAWLRDGTETPAPAAPPAETAPAWLQRVAPDTEEVTPPQPTAEEPPHAPRVVRSPERIASMQLLQQLRDAPAPEPAPQPKAARRAWLMPLLLFLIATALITALVFVLLNNRLLNFGAAPIAPITASVVQTVQSVPANRPVLIAYEWNAQRASEIRPLEEAVLGQLAERTDVPLVFMSTDPQGALLANERAAQIGAIKDNFHDQYGLGFLNLGFKAGGALALRRFGSNATFGDLLAQDVNGLDFRANNVTLQSICGGATVDACTWDNVGLLVIMADEADDVRGWFEQVRSEHPNLQTLLLTPSEIAPQVQPYAVLPSVQALAGLADADAYFRARGVANEALGRQRDAVALGTASFAALAVVGAIPAYISGRRARRRGEEDVWDR